MAKAGTVSIIGVYGEVESYPIGQAMEKNLTLTMGNCNHRRYLPYLAELVRNGSPQTFPDSYAKGAYELRDRGIQSFRLRKPGWIKVKLELASGAERANAIAKVEFASVPAQS